MFSALLKVKLPNRTDWHSYMDDISAGDKWQIVLRDLAKFIDSAKGLGLNLNNTKCEITVFTQDQQKSDMILREFRRVCPGISSVSTEDAELLGSPLGHTALQHALEEKREKIENLCKNLPLLPSHVAFFLLRHCFAMPKLMYLFRTAPTFVFMNSFRRLSTPQNSRPFKIFTLLLNSNQNPHLPAPLNFRFSSQSFKNLFCPIQSGNCHAAFRFI